MNKEQAYDAKIDPLMTQIIAICREHGIAAIASFALPIEDDESLRCTTYLPDQDGKFPDEFRDACLRIRGRGASGPLMITTTHADGTKTIRAILE